MANLLSQNLLFLVMADTSAIGPQSVNMNRGSLHTTCFRHIHPFVLISNMAKVVGLRSFQGHSRNKPLVGKKL